MESGAFRHLAFPQAPHRISANLPQLTDHALFMKRILRWRYGERIGELPRGEHATSDNPVVLGYYAIN